MSDRFFGKTREEFIDFMSDMSLTDKNLANDILSEYFGDQNPEIWELKVDIIVAEFCKRQKYTKKKYYG